MEFGGATVESAEAFHRGFFSALDAAVFA